MNDCCSDVKSRRAVSSSSATITFTPTIAYGCLQLLGRLGTRRGRARAPAAAPPARSATRTRTAGRAAQRAARRRGSSRESRAARASPRRASPARLARLRIARGSAGARARPAGNVSALVGHAAQRAHRQLVGARRAAEAEVDPARVQRRERAELLGDHERRVVREHDPARADPDRLRPAGDVRDHDRGRGAGDPDRVVMLGQPEALVAPPLGVLGEVERVAQRLGRRRALDDRREVEHGERRQRHGSRVPVGHGSVRVDSRGALCLGQPRSRGVQRPGTALEDRALVSLRRVRKENVVSRWPFSLYNDAAAALDRRFGWDKLPKPIAMLVLIGLRNILREKNLYDTGRGPLDEPDIDDHPRYLTARTLDGTFNNLDDPLMGSLGSRFGRNVPLNATVRESDPLEPNPRLVSRELLTRDEFIPATTLNLLAGAWIQFEVHDWFSHGKNETENPWLVPLDADDPWPEKPMPIARTRRDPIVERRRAADLRHRRHALVGRLPDLRARSCVRRGDQDRRARQAAHRRARPDPGRDRVARRPDRRRRQLLGRARAPALALHARAQRGLRPPARNAPRALRRRALRQGATRRLGADGEDPHDRLDAGDHRAPDDRDRAADELVGARGRAARQA